MPVSKTRRKVTKHDVRRLHEQRDIKARAQYRARCADEALRSVFESCGLHDVASAMRRAGRLARIPSWEQCLPHHLEPGLHLSVRRGWKRWGYEEYGERERWIYVPSIPPGWDECSPHQPTEVLWDGDEFELTPPRGPGHASRPVRWFDNPLRFYLALDDIESW